MQKLEHQQRREEQELAQMQEDLGRFGSANGANGANGGGVGGGVGNGILPGRQSEPTTPPEYREPPGFPSMFSRPNRYSTSSLASPPGIFNRPARSGSQLASPQAGILQPRFAFDDQLPSRSVPGSRRNSDEDEKEEAVRQDPTSHRSTNAYVVLKSSFFQPYSATMHFLSSPSKKSTPIHTRVRQRYWKDAELGRFLACTFSRHRITFSCFSEGDLQEATIAHVGSLGLGQRSQKSLGTRHSDSSGVSTSSSSIYPSCEVKYGRARARESFL